jgi:XTP/dITP diphosphohydrolase
VTAERRLVVATGNAHKVSELRAMLPGVPLVGLGAFAPWTPPREDAPDFVGNACIKALAGYAHTGLPCLADDSGLSVDALGGAPGVHSARYVDGTDTDRRHALLRALSGVTRLEARTGRFTCVLAIAGLSPGAALPAGVEVVQGCVVAVGVCEGLILFEDHGAGGFGYDALFAPLEVEVGPDGRRSTFGELGTATKNALSHRGRAVARLAPFLNGWCGLGPSARNA